MKTLTFKYTKADGKTSERVLLATVFPSDKYAGIDVTQIEPSKAAEFIAQYQQMHDDFLDKVVALQKDYELQYSYRQFFENKMTDVVEI